MIGIVKNPIVLATSAALAAYGIYASVTVTQAGKAYEIPDQLGKTYIVTGATDGIGKAMAKSLAQKNARVIMACRSRNKCLDVRRDIVFETKNREVYCRICDMSDLDSVRQFASKLIKGKHEIDRIDGIVHNAATFQPKRKVNTEGIEISLATNHMGPFLLTALLLQKLLDQPNPSRIVFVNSSVASKDTLEIDLNAINEAKYTRRGKLDAENGKFYSPDAYRYSKALELSFSRELAERLRDSNIKVLSADPGWTRTKLEEPATFKSWHWLSSFFLRRPEKAVKPILFALTDENAKNCTFISRDLEERPWGANADNPKLREQIWIMSEKWTKILDQMAKMQNELELDISYFGAPIQPQEEEGSTKGGSWKWLWLK